MISFSRLLKILDRAAFSQMHLSCCLSLATVGLRIGCCLVTLALVRSHRSIVLNMRIDTHRTQDLCINRHVCEVLLVLASFAKVTDKETHKRYLQFRSSRIRSRFSFWYQTVLPFLRFLKAALFSAAGINGRIASLMSACPTPLVSPETQQESSPFASRKASSSVVSSSASVEPSRKTSVAARRTSVSHYRAPMTSASSHPYGEDAHRQMPLIRRTDFPLLTDLTIMENERVSFREVCLSRVMNPVLSCACMEGTASDRHMQVISWIFELRLMSSWEMRALH